MCDTLYMFNILDNTLNMTKKLCKLLDDHILHVATVIMDVMCVFVCILEKYFVIYTLGIINAGKDTGGNISFLARSEKIKIRVNTIFKQYSSNVLDSSNVSIVYMRGSQFSW